MQGLELPGMLWSSVGKGHHCCNTHQASPAVAGGCCRRAKGVLVAGVNSDSVNVILQQQ